MLHEKRQDPTIDSSKLKQIMKECANRMDVSYFKTRNTEYLLDVINYSIYGIMFPLPGDYFKATDSGESAGVVGTPINMEKEY